MRNEIKNLVKGDTIRIVAPAKAIDKEAVEFAKNLLEENGYLIEISEHCLGQYDYYSGTEAERLQDFQNALDDENVGAILCARGGYGCVQLVDKIQWASFLRKPKWIIGFSDVTVLHSRIQLLEQRSIHATAPINFETNTPDAISTFLNAIKGKGNNYSIPPSEYNKLGNAEGTLVGGNLSILYSLLGTNDQMDYSNKILFIEDLSEALYVIDRMFYAFEKAGVLDEINGLIVGGMTNLKDSEPPFGKSYQEIILSHFTYSKIPICFNFPAGHIDDNRALILGNHVELSVAKTGVILNDSKQEK